MISPRTLFAAVATTIAVVAMSAVAGAAPLQDSEANDFPFPGADTMALYDGTNTYGTFGASVPGYKVPFARYRLPGNKRGPGALDVYRAYDGQPWVTWNYLSDAGGRRSRTGRLLVTGTGAAADFKVRR